MVALPLPHKPSHHDEALVGVLGVGAVFVAAGRKGEDPVLRRHFDVVGVFRPRLHVADEGIETLVGILGHVVGHGRGLRLAVKDREDFKDVGRALGGQVDIGGLLGELNVLELQKLREFGALGVVLHPHRTAEVVAVDDRVLRQVRAVVEHHALVVHIVAALIGIVLFDVPPQVIVIVGRLHDRLVDRGVGQGEPADHVGILPDRVRQLC